MADTSRNIGGEGGGGRNFQHVCLRCPFKVPPPPPPRSVRHCFKIRIQAFKIRIQAFKMRIQALKNTNSSFENTNSSLKIRIQAFKMRIQAFKIRIQAFKMRIQAFKIRIQAFKTVADSSLNIGRVGAKFSTCMPWYIKFIVCYITVM